MIFKTNNFLIFKKKEKKNNEGKKQIPRSLYQDFIS